jgi:hypothetical protein
MKLSYLSPLLALGIVFGLNSANAAPEDASGESTADTSNVDRTYTQAELLGIKPTAGFVVYTDSNLRKAARGSIGIQADLNLSSPLGLNFENWFAGLQTGFSYSHLGNATANFVGADSDVEYGNAGSNLVLIPANLKVGYQVTSWFRTSVHGGATVLYRSIPSAMILDQTSENWRALPNIGADLEFVVGKDVAIGVRPDFAKPASDWIISTTASLAYQF